MIYADNAATTAVHQSVVDAMLPCFTRDFGNPSAQHAAGRAAAEAMRGARETVARCLGCDAREVEFCASGSEADNQALRTAVAWGAPRGRTHIVASAFEHPAILNTLRELEREGAATHTLVRPDAEGLVSPEAVRAAMTPETCLVTVMTVQNEVGTVQPVSAIAEVAHAGGALFHTDAVQGAGHVRVDAAGMGIDMLSVSAHKFHGPKGVGALVCRRETLGGPLAPVSLVFGGGQERGHRAATENVPGMVGMATALSEACARLGQDAIYVGGLRDRLVRGLSQIPGAHLMGSREQRNPGTVCMCFEKANREALVALLDEAGICASAGSACSAGAVGVSPVLRAMGVPEEIAAGSLRLSLCADNTADEVDQIVGAVTDAVARLRAADAEGI